MQKILEERWSSGEGKEECKERAVCQALSVVGLIGFLFNLKLGKAEHE